MVEAIHSDEFNTADKSNVHLGKPTRKYYQDFGYDESNIIQLATITVPRSERELGGTALLGEPQTYNVVISRSITEVGDPFTYKDIMYATEEESGRDFFFYSHMKMSYTESRSGVSFQSAISPCDNRKSLSQLFLILTETFYTLLE